MTQIATGRLIDASATLEAADRALFNLWLNRGLDDEALARLANVDPDAIAARRAKITQRLSDTLGLPPATVDEALAELTASARDALAPAPEPATTETGNGAAPAVVGGGETAGAGESSATAPAPGEAEAGEPPAGEESEPPGPATSSATRRRFRFSRTWLGLLIAVVLAIVVIVALASADGSHGPHAGGSASTPPGTPSAPAPTPPAAPAAPTAPATPAPPAVPTHRPGRHPARRTHRAPAPKPTHRQTLAALPGGPVTAGGSAAVLGPPSRRRLLLIVTRLPIAPGGYYEAWLYNSILDSVPLALLHAPATRITVALPRNYQRYSWIDISFQPTGAINNSGESVLRAATPK